MAIVAGQWVPDSAKGRSQLQYAQFGLPQEQMKLEQAQQWNNVRNTIMPWLFGSGATASPGTGSTGQPGVGIPGAQMPSWMNIDWTKPYTEQQMGVFRQSNLQNASDISNAARQSSYSDMLRRGLVGEGMTSSAEPNAAFRNELLSRQLQNQGEQNLINMSTQRGDMLRGEQGSRWMALLNALNPGNTGGGTDWASIFANQEAAQRKSDAGAISGGLNFLGSVLPFFL